jgi:hypothetical protein
MLPVNECFARYIHPIDPSLPNARSKRWPVRQACTPVERTKTKNASGMPVQITPMSGNNAFSEKKTSSVHRVMFLGNKYTTEKQKKRKEEYENVQDWSLSLVRGRNTLLQRLLGVARAARRAALNIPGRFSLGFWVNDLGLTPTVGIFLTGVFKVAGVIDGRMGSG